MADKLKRGFFITFDGPEGCGKSTHSNRIKEDLLSGGYEVVYTREPGGTHLGRRIRDILLEKDDIKLGKLAELFLFEADRAQHVEEIILPALNEGKMVICDRFNMATMAYQGYGSGMDVKMIMDMDTAATGGLNPDLTILLDVDVKTGLARAESRCPADRMEKRPPEFHEKVRKGYLELAKRQPDKVKIIEVREEIEQTYELIKKEVYDFLKRCKRTT